MTPAATRRALRRASVVVIAIATLTSLSGCFPSGPTASPSPSGLATPLSVAPRSPLVVPAVLAYCPLQDAVHFSGYWKPTDEVFICRGDGHHDGDGTSTYGPWESAWEIRDPVALLKAYSAPNHRTQSTCAPRLPDPLIVWVHRNGVTTAYYAPVDGCGNPLSASASAYTAAKRTLLVEVDRGAPDPSKKDSTG